MTFETFVHNDEEARPEQQKDNGEDKDNDIATNNLKNNPSDFETLLNSDN